MAKRETNTFIQRKRPMFTECKSENDLVNITFSIGAPTGCHSAKRGRSPRVGLLGGGGKGHSTIDRFWARVQKSDRPGGCWIFAGAVCNQAGHVQIAREDGSRAYAHRFSYELHHGPIPAGLVIMHACDAPRCVNPAHLSAGTQKDNVHDAIDKGRMAPWSHPNTVAARHARKGMTQRARRQR